MSVITLATVGYGETHPLSVAGRAFTILLILGGMGIILYGVSELTQFIVQGGIAGILRRRKMERTIKKISHHYILCGAGSNGHYVLEELIRTKRSVVAVEKDPKKVQTLINRGIPTVEGDAANDNVLRSAGIDRAIGLVSTLPEDKDNLFVVITARGLNPNLRIVAKVDEFEVREKFFRSGADSAVSAPYIGGLRMASELIRPDTTTFLDSMMRDSSELRVDEVRIGSSTAYRGKAAGKPAMYWPLPVSSLFPCAAEQANGNSSSIPREILSSIPVTHSSSSEIRSNLKSSEAKLSK